MRLPLFFLFTAPLLLAQALTVGVTGGLPVTESFEPQPQLAGSFNPNTIRYTIGPSLDLRLIGPFRFEFDALYQPLSFDAYNTAGAAPTRT